MHLSASAASRSRLAAAGLSVLTGLAPGEADDVLVCFIPGRDGIPHLMKDMVLPFTVDG